MRELGVIYNSSYYSISEHPGYQGAGGDHVEVSARYKMKGCISFDPLSCQWVTPLVGLRSLVA